MNSYSLVLAIFVLEGVYSEVPVTEMLIHVSNTGNSNATFVTYRRTRVASAIYIYYWRAWIRLRIRIS